MSDQEAEKHNAKIQNSILAINKFSAKDNIDWILQRIGGVNSKILPTEYLKKHKPSLIGGTALHISYNLDNFEIFQILLGHGADITLKNQQEETVVHLVLNELIPTNYTQWEGEKMKYADLILTHHLKYKIIFNPCNSNGISHFHAACMSSNIEAMKFFLNNGVSVDQAVNMDSPVLPGYTPLHFALRFGNLEVVQILLDYNANVTLKDARGLTALHVAFRGTQEDLHHEQLVISSATFLATSLLLNHHKNYTVNPVDKDGLSHFHIACCLNNPNVIEEYLKHGVDANHPINFVFGTEDVGSTPLHLAVKNMFADYVDPFNHVKTSILLLQYGESLAAEDAYCNTPLHNLAKVDLPDANIFVAFIGAGADVNARNLEGQTPLEILLSKRIFHFDYILSEEYFGQFLDDNARTEERERRDRMRVSLRSLLHQIVPYFVEKQYHLNSFNPITQKGYLAILSQWCGVTFMEKIILETVQNYPHLLVDEMGRDLLHNFSSSQSQEYNDLERIPCAELIKLLSRLDCDVNGRDNLGRTPLHMAAFFQNNDISSELLILGADVNILDKEGRTAIEYAFKTCNVCNVMCPIVEYNDAEQVKHDDNQHFLILTYFVDHVAKLRYCKIDVSRRTKNLASKIRERFRGDVYDIEESFYREFDALKRTTIDPLSLPLSKFLSETGVLAEYPFMVEEERNVIDDYFRSQVNRERFPETTMLLNLQYRKALKRKEMIQEASDALTVLVGFDMPYLCSRRVFRFLSNSALENLIEAANAEENTSSN